MRTPPRNGPEVPADRDAGERASEDRDQAFKQLAREIRTSFILAHRRHHLARTGRPGTFGSSLVPRWDGGKDARGRVHRAIWGDVARLVLAERVDPVDLIEAAFKVAGDAGLAHPTGLLSPDVVARARDDRGLAVERLSNALQVQRDIWDIETYTITRRQGCDTETAARQALKNRLLGMGALYRYCVATRAGDVEVAGLFEVEAVEHYILNRRAFDRAWGTLIPATLKEHADRALRGG